MKRILLLLALLGLQAAPAAAERQAERAALLDEIAARGSVLEQVLGRDHISPAVRAAMLAVPRHRYVPDSQQAHAYANRPLPIGHGQTISQPLIVALMTDLLEVQPGDKVLELGTGSGYQAAVLAEMGAQVYSMEIVPPLGERARAALAEFAPPGVAVRIADGYEGWPEAAPFDAIIVTAAGDHIPPPLVEQLRPGGRMVIPVGGAFFSQQLMLVSKDPAGTVQTRALLPVRFVPLTGGR
jgi:protein-L-isoaspartate(D-aspartate) O-methyltransferase